MQCECGHHLGSNVPRQMKCRCGRIHDVPGTPLIPVSEKLGEKLAREHWEWFHVARGCRGRDAVVILNKRGMHANMARVAELLNIPEEELKKVLSIS